MVLWLKEYSHWRIWQWMICEAPWTSEHKTLQCIYTKWCWFIWWRDWKNYKCMKEKGRQKNWTVNSYGLTFDTNFLCIMFKSYVFVYTTYFEYISSTFLFSLLSIFTRRALPRWHKKLIPHFRTSAKKVSFMITAVFKVAWYLM